MRVFMMVLCGAAVLTAVGCTEPSGTNWGELNPVGAHIDVSRGDHSPGDTTINLDLDSGTTCGECTDDESGLGKDCVSIPSGTPLDWQTCVQWGGIHQCECI